MVDIVNLIFMFIYFMGPFFASFYVGLRWHAITHKHQRSTRTVVTILFGVHYMVMVFGLRISFVLSLLSNSILLAGIFLGNKFQVIGITGGIATGKSTVSSMMETAGFTIIDADKISKDVSQFPSTIADIKRTFGEEVFDDKGELDRIKLGDLVFKDKQKRKALNSIMQNRILWRMFTEFLRLRFKEGKDAIVLDVPLLYETKLLEWICYPIIVVAVNDEEVIKRRLMTRNKWNEEQALDRIRSQMPLKLKCDKADIIVNNSGNFEDLQQEF